MDHSVERCCHDPKTNSCHKLLAEQTFKEEKRKFSLTAPVACKLNQVNNGPQQQPLLLFSPYTAAT